MKVAVMLSCMYQNDTNIISRSFIQTNVVVVNQCDRDFVEEFDFDNIKNERCHCKFINTTERGLSKSRNMAINNSDADICLICDDDEIFEVDYESKINKAFVENPYADVIVFRLKDEAKDLGDRPMKIGMFRASRVCSVQIAFRRDSIVKNVIYFDSKMGSGSGNGAGEENKFLVDCLRKGLKIIYVPFLIASVDRSKSLWFEGFTEKYFRDLGWSTRRIYSDVIAYLYLILFAIRHYRHYNKQISFVASLKYMHTGFFENR